MDINELSALFTEALVKKEPMQKVARPPILQSKLKQWLQRIKAPRRKLFGPKEVASIITQKIEEALSLKGLQKNEFITSTYDNGSVRFDFGAGVPAEIKKKALDWAKRKGLKAVESPLQKSRSIQTIICGTDSTVNWSMCTQRYRCKLK